MRLALAALVTICLHVNAPGAWAQAGRDTAQLRVVRETPVVDTMALKQSSHAKLVCVACHTSLDPKLVPYRGKVEPVVCLRCHADAQFKHPFHPEVARSIRSSAAPRVSCKDCHGAHDVASAKVAGSKFSTSRLTESCGKCHEKAVQRFAGSAHDKALAAGEQGAPTCLSCHRQNMSVANGTVDSLTVKNAQVRVCLACHQDNPDARGRMSPSTKFVSPWDHSAHGTLLQRGDSAAANCVSCHGSHGILKKSDPGSTVGKDSITTTCARCHVAIGQKFNESVHGLARTSAKTDSMTCATCHSEHAKAGAAAAKSEGAKAAATQACARCHDPVTLAGTYGISNDRFQDAADSRHGLLLHDGAVTAANCASCHGAHDVKPRKDTTSTVGVAQLESNCGKCHARARARFDLGRVHGKAGDPPTSSRGWLLPVGVLVVAGAAGALLFFGRRRRPQS